MTDEQEREYWVKFPYAGKEYTVGADLYGQGSWHIGPTGETFEDDNPDFYNYVAYVNDKEAIVTSEIAAIADLILTNIYWNTQEEN